MKKGCFIKLIVIITIFTAVIIYVVQNKLEDFVLNPGRKLLKDFTEEQVREEFAFIRESAEKDSLIRIAGDYFTRMRSKDPLSGEAFEKAELELQAVIKDSIVTTDELNRLKIILERLK